MQSPLAVSKQWAGQKEESERRRVQARQDARAASGQRHVTHGGACKAAVNLTNEIMERESFAVREKPIRQRTMKKGPRIPAKPLVRKKNNL